MTKIFGFFFRLSGCYQDCRKKEKKTANNETKDSKRRHTDFLQWFSGGGDRGVRQYPGERTGPRSNPLGATHGHDTRIGDDDSAFKIGRKIE
jgi:hypothetical protein